MNRCRLQSRGPKAWQSSKSFRAGSDFPMKSDGIDIFGKIVERTGNEREKVQRFRMAGPQCVLESTTRVLGEKPEFLL